MRKRPFVWWMVRALRGDTFAREVVRSTLERTRGRWLVRLAAPWSPGNAYAADWMAWLDGLPTTLQWYAVPSSMATVVQGPVELSGPGMRGRRSHVRIP